MRLVLTSDVHTYGRRIDVPDGDVFVCAGDLTFRGTESEMEAAFRWIDGLPHAHKVVVAGNHDWFLDPRAPSEFRGWKLHRRTTISDFLARFPGITYLQDSGTEIGGLKFWGSPWQPWFWDWAFNLPLVTPMKFSQYVTRPDQHDRVAAARVWSAIPDDTDVLITHSPPLGILDTTYPDDERQGCPELCKRVDALPNLKLHVFGHLHESYGRVEYADDAGNVRRFVNAAINTREYEPTNAPIVVDL